MNNLQTSQDVSLNFKGYDITVPKGTRLTNRTACGIDPNYNFVDDLSWISKELPLLRHDAFYYGIDIPKEFVASV